MQNTLWNDVLKKLEKRINRPSFNTWLRPTSLVSMSDRNICIGVPDEVFVYWLGEYYVHVIANILAEILGTQPEISFVVMDGENRDNPEKTSGESSKHSFPATPVLQSAAQPVNNAARQALSDSQKVHQPGSANNGSGTRGRPSRPVASGNGGLSAVANNSIPLWQSTPAVSQSSRTVNTTQATELTSPWKTNPLKKSTMPPDRTAQANFENSLNPRYTFASFVVGSSNRFAHAAALAVAEQMAVNYNPLFIYGGVGLGKTHLLHAIGNYIAALGRTNRILYLSSEQFINELISSIREDRMVHFRDKYRNIDLLLIDDIQFIARKERTQEEFFHTFNTLYHERKQIVLTSDCPPKKIPTIAEQLRSRFEWGLIADIQVPDLETRIAILKKKADLRQIALPDEVALYIASKVKSNIRELEGCLSKLKAYATFNQQGITLDIARSMLFDLFESTPRKVTIELVQQAVANHYQVEIDSMKSQGRARKITFPRHIAMYLARELTNLSLPDIGRNFGGRDHSTVLHACKKVEQIQQQDLSVKKSITQLRELIKP